MTSHDQPCGEHGQITALVAVVTAGLLLAAGLVWDGALILRAHRLAINHAEAAARAGAQAINEPAYRAGTIRLDPSRASRLARAYLSAAGQVDGHTVQVHGDQIQVSVTITQPLTLLRLVGLDRQSVTGHATAHAVQAVPGGPP